MYADGVIACSVLNIWHVVSWHDGTGLALVVVGNFALSGTLHDELAKHHTIDMNRLSYRFLTNI